MSVKITTPEGKIDMILGYLLSKLPFYGRAAMYLNWSVKSDLKFPTAATDGYNVWFHPDFLMKMSDAQLLYTAVHEIHHVIKKHAILRRGRDPMLWNIACDHKINLELNEYSEARGIIEPPPDLCCDAKYKESKWLEEDVYDDLLDEPPQFTQYSTGEYEFPDEMSSEEEAEANRRVDKIIEASAKAARDAGKMPGFLNDFYNKNKEHQVNWKAKLRRFLAPNFPTHYSWEKLNKRSISRGFYTPGVIKSGISNLALLVDTSGSVSDEEISAFIAELNYIVNEMRPQNVQLIWFESSPWLIENYQQGQTLKVPKHVQRGGTSFSAAFEAITNTPKVIICLTDMYDSFEFKAGCPTMWVATSDVIAPWGETIQIKV